MKKLLSLILAIAMVLSLIPSVFAAEPETFTIDFSTLTDDSKNTLTLKEENYYMYDGNTAAGTGWSVDNSKDVSTVLKRNGNSRVKFMSAAIQILFVENDTSKDITDECNTIVFNFTAPAAGVYVFSGNLHYDKKNGASDFYIDNVKVASQDFYGSSSKYANTELAPSVFLSKGEHKLKIVTGLSQNASGSKTMAYIAAKTFTFTPVENATVSFAQTTNVDGYKDITVSSVARGDSVALTAHKETIDGYEFVGWKRGADEDNMDTWVDITGDTYNVWTNTYLTAIYKPVGEKATKTVDFWNQNGTYLGQATEATFAQDVTRVPSLTGFGAFLGWFTDGDVKLTAESVLPAGTTNAVAQYEDGAVSGVTREGETVTEADTYNEAVSLTASKTGFTCWKRDGKIVSYDDTYTYYVWGATDITEGTDVVDKTPVGILEYNEAYNAYMLEYDEGDYKIVEAGILFGGSLTIDSCAKKYTSQRKVSHNQFTAPAGDYESAKGYIIWETDSGAYAVEYIDIAE